MKKAIKFLAIIMAVCFICTAFAGCEKTPERELYNVNLADYVTLGEYKNIPVDMSSDTIKGYIEDLASSDIEQGELYNELKKGKVQEGDIANIDYEGKKDGVAFEGGTAQGHDLEIGSNSFIDGFEDGLIGVAIGATVDLNLTFPEGYQSEELAGKAVVFTVKVNSVKRAKTPQEAFTDMGFKSYAAYEKDLKERAAKQYLLETVSKNSKIKNYPETDLNYLYENQKTLLTNQISSTYNMTFEDYLKAVGSTEEDFKNDFIKEQIKPLMDSQMIIYAIADKEDIAPKKEDIDKNAEDFVKSIDNDQVTVDTVKEYYGDYHFEEITATKNVTQFLYDNANIKQVKINAPILCLGFMFLMCVEILL